MNLEDNISKVLDRQDLTRLLARSNTKASLGVALNWLVIFTCLLLVGHFPNPITILVAMLIIAGRQLGLVILMHDCSHYALFRTRWLNDFVGEWFCGAPIIASLRGYRQYHLVHHQKAGTEEDPDLANYRSYPIAKASFQRKVIRDLTGQTGIKNLRVVLAMALGFYDYTLAFRKGERVDEAQKVPYIRNAIKNLGAPLLTHAVIVLILWQLQITWTYALWWLTYLTVYQLILRIRNAAEHAALVDPFHEHPRYHTRTTLARWWERLTVAPNYVNYHLEHHLLPAVPGYNLPQLHQMLMAKNYIPKEQLCHGYGEVIRCLVKTPK